MQDNPIDASASTVELLAPAGSLSALHAAVRAGADAVYLGLDAFNARRNADNFTLDTLQEVCDYAHIRGVKVYVTLNTAIMPSEIDRAVEYACKAWNRGADAFIVQDIGVATRLKAVAPEIRVHASTQMNTHSVAGIEAAAVLGAKRVTLAREVSLDEIKRLSEVARQLGLEVETFAHGALCVCYSGQCFMSSMIGGRSANRGLCAQACRLPYELQVEGQNSPLPSPGDHLLSPQDLCSIDLIPQLIEAGVSSLKIEGRMKSPEYVYAVTGVYRAVIDRALSGEDARPTEEERRILSEAFSRGFTTAYLERHRGNDIMSYGRPNNRGVFVGRIASLKNGIAAISSEVQLDPGDVLEFWTNKGHFAYELAEVKTDKAGNVITEPDRPVGKGDRVFRVRSARAAFADDAFLPRVHVIGRIVVQCDEPLYAEFRLADNHVVVGSAEGRVVEEARTKALTEQEVREHVDRLGQTPFVLDHLDVEVGYNVGLGFSQIHKIRAAALQNLQAAIVQQYSHPSVDELEIVPFEGRRRKRSRSGSHECTVAAWVTNPSCARAAKRAGAEILYVPVLNYKRGESLLAGRRVENAEQAGYPKGAVMALPVANHDVDADCRERDCDFDAWRYVKEGKTVFAESVADALETIDRGAVAELGPHTPVNNVKALESAVSLGISRVWLSPELTLGQIADLAEADALPLGVTVIGYQELMTTEHCMLMSQGPCNQRCSECDRRSKAHYLLDRKDFRFPVVTDVLGRSHLYNAVKLDIAHVIPDLVDMGVSSVMVDTTLMDAEEASKAVSRAVRARDLAVSGKGAVGKEQGATTGHLFRGVQ